MSSEFVVSESSGFVASFSLDASATASFLRFSKNNNFGITGYTRILVYLLLTGSSISASIFGGSSRI